ncbi:MAG: amidase [Candidatus Microthrix sp.]|nr:amidase [Candidatus Microthrix sp.]
MTPAELSEMDALSQVAAIRDGSLSSGEAAEAAIAGAQAVDPALNCIVHERYDRARAEAAAADEAPAAERGPLHGLPVVVKDLDGTLAGEPYWAGSNYLKRLGYVATETSILFQRLIDAGAIIIAKTNTPELGLVPSTEPTSVGPCHNPWDLDRAPGGSSGGSAAAVSAGVVALAHAGDGGGSIRIPASNCGLVGLKPSRDLVPTYPTSTPGAAWLPGWASPAPWPTRPCCSTCSPGRTTWHHPQVRTDRAVSYLASLDGPVGPMRIAWTSAVPGGGTIDPAVAQTVATTAELLADAGHDVVEATPSILTDEAYYGQVIGWFLGAFLGAGAPQRRRARGAGWGAGRGGRRRGAHLGVAPPAATCPPTASLPPSTA